MAEEGAEGAQEGEVVVHTVMAMISRRIQGWGWALFGWIWRDSEALVRRGGGRAVSLDKQYKWGPAVVMSKERAQIGVPVETAHVPVSHLATSSLDIALCRGDGLVHPLG